MFLNKLEISVFTLLAAFDCGPSQNIFTFLSHFIRLPQEAGIGLLRLILLLHLLHLVYEFYLCLKHQDTGMEVTL